MFFFFFQLNLPLPYLLHYRGDKIKVSTQNNCLLLDIKENRPIKKSKLKSLNSATETAKFVLLSSLAEISCPVLKLLMLSISYL